MLQVLQKTAFITLIVVKAKKQDGLQLRVWELWSTLSDFDHSLQISPLFHIGHGGFTSFPCVPVCVAFVCVVPLRCLITPGLSTGLSLGLPLPTVKFPLRTAWTMQTLPTTSALPWKIYIDLGNPKHIFVWDILLLFLHGVAAPVKSS